MIELSSSNTSIFNLITSKPKRIAFFWSVFYTEYEYGIEFDFSLCIVKLYPDKYWKIVIFSNKKLTVTTFVLKTLWKTPCFFHLIHTLKDVIFQGLSESVLIFLGSNNYDALLTTMLKKMFLKIVMHFCILIFVSVL